MSLNACEKDRLSTMPQTREPLWYVERFETGSYHHLSLDEVYYTGWTGFQQISLVRSATFGKLLIIDGDMQSAQLDERIYHETLVHPALAAASDRKNVLILGGGEGATLREVLRHPGVRACTMVDIDGVLVELCKAHLPEWADGAFADPRARLVIGDAREFLVRGDERFDVIISDLTESDEGLLIGEETLPAVKRRLEPHGVYVLQASSVSPTTMSLHLKLVRSLRRYYRYVSSFIANIPSFHTDWGFIACSDVVNVALTDERVDAYCASLRGESFFYDVQAHRRIFNLPRYLRSELEAAVDVV